MRSSNPLLDACRNFGLFGLAGAALAMPSTAPAAEGDNYTWSAELVAVDPAASTVTVKAFVVVPEAQKSVTELSAGDDVTVIWSGLTTSSAVRAVEREPDSSLGRLTLPAEFVSTELDGRYVVFEVRVPNAAAAALREVPAGSWVTGTSPFNANDAEEAVASMRPYSDG